ncbi:uncharacterized protein N0V89_007080 [Didymosphaeria variabile]|uniref:Uncharacterized protein n=1 Tax=Didymosphaeria variabile TaxID=1932322 RepID=A0A9W8XIZ3_9PLEO|nr:uncharacterized protein N0V89_007080 [Didymosphaeria variabile]KAJ4351737.1 hypothetical protein N0V89_007080 [Didymosphaeria variabile]
MDSRFGINVWLVAKHSDGGARTIQRSPTKGVCNSGRRPINFDEFVYGYAQPQQAWNGFCIAHAITFELVFEPLSSNCIPGMFILRRTTRDDFKCCESEEPGDKGTKIHGVDDADSISWLSVMEPLRLPNTEDVYHRTSSPGVGGGGGELGSPPQGLDLVIAPYTSDPIKLSVL